MPMEKKEDPQFRRRISSNGQQRAMCSRHSGEMLKLYCFDCQKRVCRDCTITEHKGHKCDYMNSHEVAKQEILSALAPVREFKASVSEALEEVGAAQEAVVSQGEAVAEMISESFKKLQLILDKRKQSLLQESQNLVDGKMVVLREQEKELQEAQGEMGDLITYVDKASSETAIRQLVAMQNDLCQQILDLMHKNHTLYLRPKESANVAIHTVPADKLAQLCEDHSEVYQFRPDPTRCILEGAGLEAATTKQESRFTLDLVDMQGHLCKTKQSVRAELTSELSGSTIKATLVRYSTSSYELAYTPMSRGRHHLLVQVNNKDIASFKVFVQHPPTQLSQPMDTISGVHPTRIALSEDGELYITESQHSRVSVFSRAGKKIKSIGIIGCPPFGYARTTGIAIANNGDTYVSTFASKVYKISSSGDVLAVVGREGSGEGEFHWADGMKIHDGQLFVCDYGNSRVNVFDLDLKFIRSFGKSTEGPGQLMHPADIAIDSKGRVFVVDYSKNEVVVFSSDGTFLSSFGGEGSGDGKLKCPVGICTTPNHIYVSEQSNNRISIFHTSGQFVGTLGKAGSEAGELNYPWGITVDHDGFLFICDSKNNRIQVF